MTKMTIAKALRYKKRVTAKVNKLEQDIISNNSILEGAEREIDIESTLAKRDAAVRHLIDVKLAISVVSSPIQRMILECAEAKSRISFLTRIPTNHGLQSDRWGDGTNQLDATIRKAKVDAEIRELEELIDTWQSNIDSFNNANYVEFQSPIGD